MSAINVILSAQLADASNNADRDAMLKEVLEERGIDFIPARGSYKGVEEQSIVTVIYFNDDLAFVKTVAFRVFGQESVLVIEPDLRAVLHYNDGRMEPIGYMHRIDDESEARKHDGWTRVRYPGDEFYWVASSVLPNCGYVGPV